MEVGTTPKTMYISRAMPFIIPMIKGMNTYDALPKATTEERIKSFIKILKEGVLLGAAVSLMNLNVEWALYSDDNQEPPGPQLLMITALKGVAFGAVGVQVGCALAEIKRRWTPL